jgi:hypothetical protein
MNAQAAAHVRGADGVLFVIFWLLLAHGMHAVWSLHWHGHLYSVAFQLTSCVSLWLTRRYLQSGGSIIPAGLCAAVLVMVYLVFHVQGLISELTAEFVFPMSSVYFVLVAVSGATAPEKTEIEKFNGD